MIQDSEAFIEFMRLERRIHESMARLRDLDLRSSEAGCVLRIFFWPRRLLVRRFLSRSRERRASLLKRLTQEQADYVGQSINIKALKRIESDIGRAIEHENELLNHRIQWFLTITGFLLGAIALYGPNTGRDFFAL